MVAETAPKNQWLKFYPTDWQADELLATCSFAARGFLMELICVMHRAAPYGHLLINGKPPSDAELARLTRAASVTEVRRVKDELLTRGVLSTTDEGTIYSRRMVRKAAVAGINKANGLEGGNPNWRRGSVPKEDRVGPLPAGTKARVFDQLWERCGGRCCMCHEALSLNGDSPFFAHVDHIVPRCDGGTHDVSNLRLLCRVCNHKRKNVDEPTGNPTDRTNPPQRLRTNTEVRRGEEARSEEARSQIEEKNVQAPPAVRADARSKRPIFKGQRFVVFEWQLDDLRKLLGKHTDGFDLHAWFDALDRAAEREDAVIPQRDGGQWLLAKTMEEAERRGLPIASANTKPHPLSQSMFPPGTTAADLEASLRESLMEKRR